MALTIAILMGEIGGGGAERVSTLIANYLHDQGYHVHLICFISGDVEYPVNAGIQLHYLKKSGHKYVNLAVRAVSLKGYLASVSPDVLISLGFGYHYLGFCHAFSRYKVILSERNDPFNEYKDVFSKWMIRHDFGKAHAVVFQTKGAMSFFSDSIRRKSTIIANPVMSDLPDVFSGKRRECVVAVCRLDPQKNLPLLLRSFARFRQKHDGYILEIYGRGSMEEVLKRQINELGLSKSVIFMGFRKDVHNLIRDAAMFVSSSDYEGISNSMVEALALGLPCISTDCPPGGAGMLIRNGENGYLIPVGDEKGLAEAMAMIVDNLELASIISANASKIRHELSINIIGRKWDECIQGLTR